MGPAGILTSAAVLGLTDVDMMVSMARGAAYTASFDVAAIRVSAQRAVQHRVEAGGGVVLW